MVYLDHVYGRHIPPIVSSDSAPLSRPHHHRKDHVHPRPGSFHCYNNLGNSPLQPPFVTFMRSWPQRTESVFIPTFWLTIATLVSNMQQYGVPSSGPWLPVALRVLFWTYSACTFASAILQYHLLFTGKPLTIQSMATAWLLPIFPLMLCGTLASVTAGTQPAHHGIPIIIPGVTFQGVGFIVEVFMYGNYVSRLMLYGLPSLNTRPGMFIAVGPPSFTALALIGMANVALIIFPHTWSSAPPLCPQPKS